MRQLSLTPAFHARCLHAITEQPDHFYDGAPHAGHAYQMSPGNYRQQQRISRALADAPQTSRAGITPDAVRLSRADWQYLYAVLAYQESRQHPLYRSGSEQIIRSYYQLNRWAASWQEVTTHFNRLGLRNIPGYQAAWSA